MEKRRKFTPQEKSKIVLEVLREEKTLSQIGSEYQVHPNIISRWKAEFIANADKLFSKEADEVGKINQAYEQEKDDLLRQIGQLSYEVVGSKNLVETKSRKERMAMKKAIKSA